MLFTSMQYLLFLPAVVLLYWILPHKFRLPMLLAASYIFYMSWIPAFILLIAGLTAFNWLWGMFMHEHMQRRKLLLGLGIGGNLATLALFKYANFAVSSAAAIAHAFGQANAHWVVNIILPLGISFFTFEFIHYLFEIYRGGKPVRSFVLFALFAAFFPTQIAGPIKRYQDFVAQMCEEKKIELAYFDEGVPLIILGLAKKLLLANNLAMFVQTCFAAPSAYGALELWVFAWAFTFQIYFDFSAYTDIGRGSAMLFGYHIPINFNLPFLAANMSDFWRRWHISLSTWLRDYLFIPIGGSRGGQWRTNWNIFITMALGGLWHGAAWNFVVWGIFHGLCLVVQRQWCVVKEKLTVLSPFWNSKIYNWLSIWLTFNAVAIGCVFFGLQNIKTAFSMIWKMVTLHPLLTKVEAGHFLVFKQELPITVLIMLGITLTLILTNLPVGRLIESGRLRVVPPPVRAAYCTALVLLMVMFLSDNTQPFIYFQF
ncbi:MAG: MBOAT family O-acyltransferase [Terriglobales bacterium]